MELRDRIARLEKDARSPMVSIPLQDGGVARFPQSELAEAFILESRRLRGEEIEPHPLTLAAANSSEAKWRESFFSEMHAAGVEDLSE